MLEELDFLNTLFKKILIILMEKLKNLPNLITIFYPQW